MGNPNATPSPDPQARERLARIEGLLEAHLAAMADQTAKIEKIPIQLSEMRGVLSEIGGRIARHGEFMKGLEADIIKLKIWRGYIMGAAAAAGAIAAWVVKRLGL